MALQSIGDATAAWYSSVGSSEHLAMDDGDYIGADGYVHCGTCGEPKEYRLKVNGRLVRVLCACGLEERNRRDARMRELQKAKRMADMGSFSLRDARYQQATFENFKVESPDDDHVLRVCRNYVLHFDEMYRENVGLLFYGHTGTGKTFAADCVANALAAKGEPVLVTSIIRMADMRSDDGFGEMVSMMNASRLLVLDDFGAERNTEYMSERVFAVIDARYMAKKPMIITTNLTDFKTETDVRRQRVYDRIAEVCMPIKMDGASKRKDDGAKRRAMAKAMLEE